MQDKKKNAEMTIANTHPLDPLTIEEIEAAVKLVRKQEGINKPYFSSVGLLEPDKSMVKAHREGDVAERIVQLLGVDEGRDGGFQADVDMGAETVDVQRVSLGSQVPYNYSDFGLAIHLTKTNPEWLAAVRARGVSAESEEDLKKIQIGKRPNWSVKL